MAINPFERKFSMTAAEKETAEKSGKTPEEIAAEKKRFEQATARANEPKIYEISEEEMEEVSKFSLEKLSKAFEKKD